MNISKCLVEAILQPLSVLFPREARLPPLTHVVEALPDVAVDVVSSHMHKVALAILTVQCETMGVAQSRYRTAFRPDNMS
jgi:hypothetical protein